MMLRSEEHAFLITRSFGIYVSCRIDGAIVWECDGAVRGLATLSGSIIPVEEAVCKVTRRNNNDNHA
jgi:hypothetical protein